MSSSRGALHWVLSARDGQDGAAPRLAVVSPRTPIGAAAERAGTTQTRPEIEIAIDR